MKHLCPTNKKPQHTHCQLLCGQYLLLSSIWINRLQSSVLNSKTIWPPSERRLIRFCLVVLLTEWKQLAHSCPSVNALTVLQLVLRVRAPRVSVNKSVDRYMLLHRAHVITHCVYVVDEVVSELLRKTLILKVLINEWWTSLCSTFVTRCNLWCSVSFIHVA